MIGLENVSFEFDGSRILEDVNLNIKKGEVFVLIGPSGQGKSVLLKLLGGILKPTRGRVLIENRDLNELPRTERIQVARRIGMLFQKNALFDSLTCFENVAFPMREMTSLQDEEIKLQALAFIDAVGLSHAVDLYPDEMSGGMQKRLGIARALSLHPEIIFYDDPTAGLDPITSRKIIQLIIELQQKNNSTVVAITNDMNRAYQMADRIGMVVDRRLIMTGSRDETQKCLDPRVQQFIRGTLTGPLTVQS